MGAAKLTEVWKTATESMCLGAVFPILVDRRPFQEDSLTLRVKVFWVSRLKIHDYELHLLGMAVFLGSHVRVVTGRCVLRFQLALQ